jgi:hypothetical protein
MAAGTPSWLRGRDFVAADATVRDLLTAVG